MDIEPGWHADPDDTGPVDDVDERQSDVLAGGTPADPVETEPDEAVRASPPGPGRGKALIVLSVAAVVLIAAGLGGYFVFGRGADASAAVSTALTDSLHDRTADLTMNMTISGGTTTAKITADGDTDFTNDQTNLTMNIGELGHSLTERAVYDGATAFVNLGEVVGEIVPGKSWVSLSIGQQGSGSGAGGLTNGMSGNPTAMLKVLSAQGNDVTPLGGSTVDGDPVQGYSVKMTPAELKKDVSEEHLPSWMQQAMAQVHESDVTYQVYIDGSNLLKSVANTVHITADNQTLVEHMNMTYSNYGTSVSVVDPPSDQVVPFSQFLQAATAKGSNTTI
jgi:hypothetical protein